MLAEKVIPDPSSLIESLRSIGYSFEAAIADLIDNSISANANKIEIDFEVDDAYLSIFDNGTGMNYQELISAMRFGSKNPNDNRRRDDLGRFGLGLKSASLSQCKELIVATKKDSKIAVASWNLDYIKETNEWSVLVYDEKQLKLLKLKTISKLDSVDSGTIIYWKQFDKLLENTKQFKNTFLKHIDITYNHLALIFHRFLGDRLEILINNNKIHPIDPFLEKNLATQKKEEQIKIIDNEQIKVRPYILPHLNKMTKEEIASLGGKVDLKKNQGYYIYRNNRLIIYGKWFNQYPKSELAKLVRVRVDIPNTLDYLWEIDVKKSQAVIPNSIRSSLGMMINESLKIGKRVFTYEGKKKNNSNKINVWNRFEDRNVVRYEINKNHPIIQQIINSPNKEKNDIINLISLIEDQTPYYQIYLDQAESDKSLEKENLFNNNKLSKMYAMINQLDDKSKKSFLDNFDEIEMFELSDEEKKILFKRFGRGI